MDHLFYPGDSFWVKGKDSIGYNIYHVASAKDIALVFRCLIAHKGQLRFKKFNREAMEKSVAKANL